LSLELRPIKLERTDVLSVSVTIDVDGDLGSPIDEADVSARNIVPLSIDLLEELLEVDVVLIHFGQLIPRNLQGLLVLLRLLRVLTLRLLLQANSFQSQAVGVSDVLSNLGFDLVKGALESTESGKSNILASCASTLELVINGRILAEDVVVADAKDPGTRFGILGLVLVEEKGDATLGIGSLPLLRSDRHAERSCERATDVVGGVGVVGDAQKGRTCQLLNDALVPFHHRTLDFIGLEKIENGWGSIVRILGGGGGGMGGNPYNDGAESFLPVLAEGGETSCLDGRVPNAAVLQ